jgi:hypothetical protein
MISRDGSNNKNASNSSTGTPAIEVTRATVGRSIIPGMQQKKGGQQVITKKRQQQQECHNSCDESNTSEANHTQQHG